MRKHLATLEVLRMDFRRPDQNPEIATLGDDELDMISRGLPGAGAAFASETHQPAGRRRSAGGTPPSVCPCRPMRRSRPANRRRH
jgi:hypothetical protein